MQEITHWIYTLKRRYILKKELRILKTALQRPGRIYRVMIILLFLSPFLAMLPHDTFSVPGVLTGAASPDNAKVNIVKVIDGDTLSVDYNGRRENVRLIGIDTPESFAGKKARRDSKRSHTDMAQILQSGRKAAEYTKTLVKPGELLTVEFDVEKRDRYGRLLVYIFLADGRMLNEEIIKNGYASVLTIPPNVNYQKRFIEAYRHARRNNLGLWQ
jgi:micrococcal nuclease